MRTEPGLKFERPPLQLALVQVRFSTVTAMRGYVPPLQDKLRKSGFPGFSEESTQHITIGPEPSVKTNARWCFVGRKKRESVVLTEDFVVYETSQYGMFEEFIERFKMVLVELNDVAEISFVSQIGLRYVDVICSLDGHPPEWFLREQFHGLSAKAIREQEVVNQFLASIKTSEGSLRLKSHSGKGPGFMPPDLTSKRLDFGLELTENDSFRILDFDHIWKGEIDFVPDLVVEKMWQLHAPIKKTFQAVVTEKAMSVWESKGDEK